MHDLTAVPSPQTDDAIVTLADWVEISAVLHEDGNVSREDLVRALSRTYSTPEGTARERAGDVFKELADRHVCCAQLQPPPLAAYPFYLEKNQAVLAVRHEYYQQIDYGLIYLFLVAMTRADMGAGARVLSGVDPTKVFERLCADALAGFWGGHSEYSGTLVFGTARKKRDHDRRFQSNINHLCQQIGEGVGFRKDAKLPGAGDGKLDLVAWRRFPDNRQGNLVGFAQCKTGIHWKKYLTQLQPRAFCSRFMKKPLILDPVRIYMVPWRIDPSQWETHTGEGGMLFDRCRILQYTSSVSPDVAKDVRSWLKAAMDLQKARQFTT